MNIEPTVLVALAVGLVLGALSVPAGLAKAGPNHYLTNSAAIPTRGGYQMLIEVEQILNGQLIDTAGVLTVPSRWLIPACRKWGYWLYGRS